MISPSPELLRPNALPLTRSLFLCHLSISFIQFSLSSPKTVFLIQVRWERKKFNKSDFDNYSDFDILNNRNYSPIRRFAETETETETDATELGASLEIEIDMDTSTARAIVKVGSYARACLAGGTQRNPAQQQLE